MYAYGNPMDNLSSGLRSGAAIGGMIKGGMDTSAVQNAAQRIQAGENQQAVISELMAQSPQAAQQLMNLLGGQQNLDAGAQEVVALKQRVGDQIMKSAALPMMMALHANDDAVRSQFINATADIFEKQSPETAQMLRDMTKLTGKNQFDAVAGSVKSMQMAGVFPDDPSQLQQGTALGQNLSLYDQAVASGDMERAEMIKRNIDPGARAFAQSDARVNMEQSLNPIIAAREAGKIGAVEQTATGGAKLQQEQQAVAKGEREVAEAKRAKENAASAINSQLQQIQRLESHPGFEWAVGTTSLIPSVRGSEAYGFEKQLEKLDAQSFMAMIPNLAGMGALSNAEGQKVSAALSALNIGLSEEEFRKEMSVIRETLIQARDRLKTGNTLPPEQAAPAASTVGRFKVEVQ